MKKKIAYIVILIIIGVVTFSCYSYYRNSNGKINIEETLTYCDIQVRKTLYEIENDSCLLPRKIEANASGWYMISAYDWTSGFWPGILWYGYENTGDEFIRRKAIKYTDCLTVLLDPDHKGDHDLGFQFFL